MKNDMNTMTLKTITPQVNFPRGTLLLALLGVMTVMSISTAQAAIALDRTRAIINGGEKSISLNISNENQQLPYLAQAWIEDGEGQKITEPFTVLPPVQRVEPGAKSQVKIQALPSVAQLPQDRESVYYFNLREIPPKSDQPNTLQLALQTRIKLFYRPTAIVPTRQQMDNPWQEQVTLSQQNGQYTVTNPTPFFVTLVDATSRKDGESVKGFEPMMVPPKSTQPLGLSVSVAGNSPVLTYINDYGGRPTLTFSCQASQCHVVPVKK